MRTTPLAALLLGWATLFGFAGEGGASLHVPEGAHGVGALDEEDPRVEARLLLDTEAARPGQPLRAGVLLDLDRGWHVYWRNPGSVGLPTKLSWDIPDAEVRPLGWPAPEIFQEAGGFTTYGYEGQVLLTVGLRFEGPARGERLLRVEASFLACKVQCIPGRVTLTRTLLVGSESRPADPATRALFERYAQRIPRTPESLDLDLEALYSQSAIRPGDSFRAAIAVTPRVTHGYATLGSFDPSESLVLDRIESIEVRVTGSRPHPVSEGGFLVTLEGHAAEREPFGDGRLRGVLAVRVPMEGVRHVEVDLPLPRAGTGSEVATLEGPWLEPLRRSLGISLWRAILLALAGGVILNLMPCVLPVLALKVCGITELAHQSRAGLLKHGLAYTAGILVTMGALAGTVVLLRAAGTAVGWGFQFQEPWFVSAIAAVLVLFALNLFGVFEIYVSSTRISRIGEGATGSNRSFFEGLLAVILATPCSAPFLGTAVGFAFASSAPVIVAIFLAIGLGLAAPFLLVALVPGWARLIPRPGPWMLHLRRGLGFALVGTVVWLLWLTGRSIGTDGLVALLSFLLSIAFVAWIYGALQAARRAPLARGAVLVLGGGLAVAGFLAFAPAADPSLSAAHHEDGWQTFDREAIRGELRQGRPVFVDFTADWCLTCKANERFVISDARVQAELKRLGVATFRADWTRRDESIRAELARFGRAGVPLYLVYSPTKPDEPEVLPELLGVDRVVDALRRAAGPALGISAQGESG